MNLKKWLFAAASTAMARRYPVWWTALIFAVIPLLLRSASSLGEGGLSLQLGGLVIPSSPFIGSVAFASGLTGLVKYGSSEHVLAYGLWVVTFLCVAIVGIVMFEAFSPPREWSGSLALPALIVTSCGAGALVGAIVLRIRRYRRRIGHLGAR
jgi:hypothetical protein